MMMYQFLMIEKNIFPTICFSKYFLGYASPLKSSKTIGELQTPPGTSRTSPVYAVYVLTKNVSKSMVLVQALLRSIT